MSYRLHNITSLEPVGSTVYHYGYKCEVKEEGSVWAEIPAELYELELSAGRIREPAKKVSEPLPPADPVDFVEPQVPVVEPVEEVAVKIDGRSKAAKQNKR